MINLKVTIYSKRYFLKESCLLNFELPQIEQSLGNMAEAQKKEL